LNASHNQLTGLPESFELLENLEGLILNDNKISSLPEHIGSLACLRTLHVHNNEICSLSKDFNKLKNLQEFSLEWFSYANPPVSRIVKSEAIISSFRDDFCMNSGRPVESDNHMSGNRI
jgi:Leucine-rich repeat (LRR) protein